MLISGWLVPRIHCFSWKTYHANTSASIFNPLIPLQKPEKLEISLSDSGVPGNLDHEYWSKYVVTLYR